MIVLTHLKALRTRLAYPRVLLSGMSGIAPQRLRQIELREVEPWFDETVILTRLLGISSVMDLIASCDLTSFEDDPKFFAHDVRYWAEGVRLPLPMALRLARRFGLARPDDLDVPALTRQIWDVLSATERHPEAPGWCAWCQADIAAGEAHSGACLPFHLWGERPSLGFTSEAIIGEARPGVSGRRGGRAIAHGLHALRKAHGLTQERMGQIIGLNANYYSRIERGVMPLTLERGTALADRFGVSRDSIYLRPEIEPAPSDAAGS